MPDRHTLDQQTLSERIVNEDGTLTHKAAEMIETLLHRVGLMEDNLKTNTEATQRVEDNTGQLVELLNAGRGAMRVLDLVGKLAKPMGYILGVITATVGLVVAWKSGVTPK